MSSNKTKIVSSSAMCILGGLYYLYNREKNKNREDITYVSDVKKNFKNVKFKEKDNLYFHNRHEHFNDDLKIFI